MSSESPGTNATTNSGERSTFFQYSFFASASTWFRSWRPWFARQRSPLRLVVGFVRVEEGLEWDLRVDGDVPSARKVHDHVRPDPPVVGVGGHLLVEVAVLEHPRHLDDPAQLHLAPPTPGLGGAQRGHQVAGLLLELVVGGREVLHLLGKHPVGALPLALQPLHPLLVLVQLLTDRLEQRLDRLLTLGELAVGGLTSLPELRIGQLEELLVVLLECNGREACELAGELTATLLEHACALVVRASYVVELGRDPCQLGTEGRGSVLSIRRDDSRVGEVAFEDLVAFACIDQPGLCGAGRTERARSGQQAHHEPDQRPDQQADQKTGDHCVLLGSSSRMRGSRLFGTAPCARQRTEGV